MPTPAQALLPEVAGRQLAAAVAEGLQAQEVPAVAAEPRAGDWRLVVTADQRNGVVVPVYTVENPKGEDRGRTEGQPVALAAWASGEPGTFKQAAADATPNIAALLTRIEAARQRSDPNSLLNRAARVDVADVEGAPGDGNQQLTKQMRDKLSQLGPAVQDTPNGADFLLQGHVRMVRESAKLERVEIQWVLKAANGDERGRIVQLNEVPSGSLDRYWGDVAVVVAQEASAGVRDALLTQSGRR